MKNCIIFGAGPRYRHKPPLKGDALIIAADGGYESLCKSGISADVVIGDFDSLSVPPDHPKVIQLEKEKDDTDMLAAIRYALSEGCSCFHLYGGAGGRTDHTLANIQCLAYLAQQGAEGYLYGKDFVMTCICNGYMDLDPEYQGIFSVFSYSETASGVSLERVKYELHKAELNNAFPIGVSNEFIGAAARFSVENGTLLIILPYDKKHKRSGNGLSRSYF